MARWHRFLPLIAIAAVLAACGAQEPTDPPEPEEASSETEEEAADRGTDELDPPQEEQDMESERPRQVFPEEQGSEGPDAREESPGDDRAPDSGLDEEIEMALEDASSSTGVPKDDISVTSAQRVTWNDGSLGCPEPGGMYTQALVDGYRIILSVDGRERAYHGQDGQEPFYCANPQERSGGGTVDR